MSTGIAGMTIADYDEVFADNKAAIAFWKKLGWRCYEEVGVKVMSLRIERAAACSTQDRPDGRDHRVRCRPGSVWT